MAGAMRRNHIASGSLLLFAGLLLPRLASTAPALVPRSRCQDTILDCDFDDVRNTAQCDKVSDSEWQIVIAQDSDTFSKCFDIRKYLRDRGLEDQTTVTCDGPKWQMITLGADGQYVATINEMMQQVFPDVVFGDRGLCVPKACYVTSPDGGDIEIKDMNCVNSGHPENRRALLPRTPAPVHPASIETCHGTYQKCDTSLATGSAQCHKLDDESWRLAVVQEFNPEYCDEIKIHIRDRYLEDHVTMQCSEPEYEGMISSLFVIKLTAEDKYAGPLNGIMQQVFPHVAFGTDGVCVPKQCYEIKPGDEAGQVQDMDCVNKASGYSKSPRGLLRRNAQLNPNCDYEYEECGDLPGTTPPRLYGDGKFCMPGSDCAIVIEPDTAKCSKISTNTWGLIIGQTLAGSKERCDQIRLRLALAIPEEDIIVKCSEAPGFMMVNPSYYDHPVLISIKAAGKYAGPVNEVMQKVFSQVLFGDQGLCVPQECYQSDVDGKAGQSKDMTCVSELPQHRRTSRQLDSRRELLARTPAGPSSRIHEPRSEGQSQSKIIGLNTATCSKLSEFGWRIEVRQDFDPVICGDIKTRLADQTGSRLNVVQCYGDYETVKIGDVLWQPTVIDITADNQFVGHVNEVMQQVYPDVLFGEQGLCVTRECYDAVPSYGSFRQTTSWTKNENCVSEHSGQRSKARREPLEGSIADATTNDSTRNISSSVSTERTVGKREKTRALPIETLESSWDKRAVQPNTAICRFQGDYHVFIQCPYVPAACDSFKSAVVDLLGDSFVNGCVSAEWAGECPKGSSCPPYTSLTFDGNSASDRIGEINQLLQRTWPGIYFGDSGLCTEEQCYDGKGDKDVECAANLIPIPNTRKRSDSHYGPAKHVAWCRVIWEKGQTYQIRIGELCDKVIIESAGTAIKSILGDDAYFEYDKVNDKGCTDGVYGDGLFYFNGTNVNGRIGEINEALQKVFPEVNFGAAGLCSEFKCYDKYGWPVPECVDSLIPTPSPRRSRRRHAKPADVVLPSSPGPAPNNARCTWVPQFQDWVVQIGKPYNEHVCSQLGPIPEGSHLDNYLSCADHAWTKEHCFTGPVDGLIYVWYHISLSPPSDDDETGLFNELLQRTWPDVMFGDEGLCPPKHQLSKRSKSIEYKLPSTAALAPNTARCTWIPQWNSYMVQINKPYSEQVCKQFNDNHQWDVMFPTACRDHSDLDGYHSSEVDGLIYVTYDNTQSSGYDSIGPFNERLQRVWPDVMFGDKGLCKDQPSYRARAVPANLVPKTTNKVAIADHIEARADTDLAHIFGADTDLAPNTAKCTGPTWTNSWHMTINQPCSPSACKRAREEVQAISVETFGTTFYCGGSLANMDDTCPPDAPHTFISFSMDTITPRYVGIYNEIFQRVWPDVMFGDEGLCKAPPGPVIRAVTADTMLAPRSAADDAGLAPNSAVCVLHLSRNYYYVTINRPCTEESRQKLASVAGHAGYIEQTKSWPLMGSRQYRGGGTDPACIPGDPYTVVSYDSDFDMDIGLFNEILQKVWPDVMFGDQGLCAARSCYTASPGTNMGFKSDTCAAADQTPRDPLDRRSRLEDDGKAKKEVARSLGTYGDKLDPHTARCSLDLDSGDFFIEINDPCDEAVCEELMLQPQRGTLERTDTITCGSLAYDTQCYRGNQQHMIVTATIKSEEVGALNEQLQQNFKDVLFGDEGLCIDPKCYDFGGFFSEVDTPFSNAQSVVWGIKNMTCAAGLNANVARSPKASAHDIGPRAAELAPLAPNTARCTYKYDDESWTVRINKPCSDTACRKVWELSPKPLATNMRCGEYHDEFESCQQPKSETIIRMETLFGPGPYNEVLQQAYPDVLFGDEGLCVDKKCYDRSAEDHNVGIKNMACAAAL